MQELVLATHNDGKITELKEQLAPLGITVLTHHDVDLPEVAETGQTFIENATLKAEAIAAHTGKPALADDSGLCVDALNGEPGVDTANYGGYEKLLTKLKDTAFGARGARFVCVLALAEPNAKTQFFDGYVDGFILNEARGEGGFGYDPVFLPTGGTHSFAEDPEQKKTLSHRSRAIAKLVEALK